MDEAILDVVELIDVLHNFLTLFLYKVLDKSVSANGNPKANVAVVYKGLGGEQRTEVGEGGISSKQALCGRVRLSRRDTAVMMINGSEDQSVHTRAYTWLVRNRWP